MNCREESGFPEQINRLINGRTVDLSNIHNQYLTLLEGVRQNLGDSLRRRPGQRYEASPEFFLAFQRHLRQVVDQHFQRSPMNAADLIGIALFRAAVLGGVRESSRREEVSRFRDLLATMRRRERTNFDRLVGFPIRRDSGFSVRRRHNRVVLKNRTGTPNSTLISFVCGLERGGTEPTLSLDMNGEPVRELARAIFGENNDRFNRLANWREAKKLWLEVLEELFVMAGSKNPKGGRPQERYVKEGKFLRDICGLSWVESAAEVCPEDHRHGRNCGERLRKAVEQLKRRSRGNV